MSVKLPCDFNFSTNAGTTLVVVDVVGKVELSNTISYPIEFELSLFNSIFDKAKTSLCNTALSVTLFNELGK